MQQPNNNQGIEVDTNIVIEIYKQRIQALTNENIMLIALLEQERQQAQAKENSTQE